MRETLFKRVTRIAVAVALLGAFSAQVAAAAVGPDPSTRRVRRGFSLYAEVFTLFLVNNVACGIDNLGQICTDPGNSPIGGGGFWPKGTPDQYIFNSGLQVAGIIPADAGFDWAGDTVGAFFMDARGDQGAGDGITPVFSSLEPVDAQDWPNGAVVRDTAVYADVLLGRNFVSQQDLWVRTWDGNPNFLTGRTHPMGVLVEERGMAWNFPTGNEDILYFVFDVYNVTASAASAYSELDPAIASEIAAVGAQFQTQAEAAFGVSIPDEGYAIENAYVAFFMDPDVEDAFHNFSTAILPFQLAVAYKHDFQADPSLGWVFPAAIFGAPFAPAPGFVGVKYLKSPIDPNTGEEAGLALFSNTRNASTGFPDPVGVIRLWRYLSGNINTNEGDLPCTIANPIANKLCFLDQLDADTRFYQSSGPLTLEPGRKQTVVVAYLHAAPLAEPIAPFIGGSMRPGIPRSGQQLAQPAAGDTVRDIERATGWLSHSDLDGNGVISQDEVVTAPRSLLQKSLVAQAVFDNKFLLPFAPEPPNFFLVPGPDQVSVVWEPSPTEVAGDPFFEVAGSPLDQSGAINALFDPNFRQIDVEGYRIYRGRTPGALSLIAQFDYPSTTFIDFTGAIDYGNCAPELGVFTDCPVQFDVLPNVDPASSPSNAVPITGDLVQVPAGGRAVLNDGSSVIVITSDTAVTGEQSGFPGINNVGVPFAFVDRGVRNSLTYFYAVTAYDVNSVASGPTSLESARIARSVTPRGSAPNLENAVATIALLGRGDTLDPGADFAIDPETGTFTGPSPPTDLFSPFLNLFAGTALAAGELSVRIDSIAPEYYHNGTYYLTVAVGADTSRLSFGPDLPLGQEEFSPGVGDFDPILVPIPANAEAATDIGQEGLPLAGLVEVGFDVREVTFSSKDVDWHVEVEGSFFASTPEGITSEGGTRWFSGDEETTPDPTLGTAHGALDGVDVIYSPAPFTANVSEALFRRNMQTVYHVFRAADIKVYWGATAGTVDSVIDVTHNLPLDFVSGANIGPGYGFRTDISGNDLDYTAAPGADGMVTFYDFGHGPCFPERPNWTSTGCEGRPFAAAATLSPVDVDGDAAPDGQGFAMYINGEFYIFQTSTLPSSTVWTYRSYFGDVKQALDGTYSFTPRPRNPAVPGLEIRVNIEAPAVLSPLTAADLDRVHTVPDPYYVTSALEISPNRKLLKFVNLPPQAIIRIYSVSGVLIDILEHNDESLGGEATWNLRNRNNQFVASGVYFYHVETAEGLEKIGRFTVVNFAQ